MIKLKNMHIKLLFNTNIIQRFVKIRNKVFSRTKILHDFIFEVRT